MNSVDEILDFAIQREQEAADFYDGLAQRVESAWMKEMLLSFKAEELRHKGKLKSVKKGEQLLSSSQRVQDLKISDYLVDVQPTPDITLQDAMIIAMKREKMAHRLYSDLAAKAQDPQMQELFAGLAKEEARHKLYFEEQYDEQVMRDN